MTAKPMTLWSLGRDNHNRVVAGRNWISGGGGSGSSDRGEKQEP